MKQNVSDPILRMKHVEVEVGLAKSTIYALIKSGGFPAPISLGKRASGWLLSEIIQWRDERIKESRQGEVKDR